MHIGKPECGMGEADGNRWVEVEMRAQRLVLNPEFVFLLLSAPST